MDGEVRTKYENLELPHCRRHWSTTERFGALEPYVRTRQGIYVGDSRENVWMAGGSSTAWCNEVFMQIVAMTYNRMDRRIVTHVEFGTRLASYQSLCLKLNQNPQCLGEGIEEGTGTTGHRDNSCEEREGTMSNLNRILLLMVTNIQCSLAKKGDLGKLLVGYIPIERGGH